MFFNQCVWCAAIWGSMTLFVLLKMLSLFCGNITRKLWAGYAEINYSGRPSAEGA